MAFRFLPVGGQQQVVAVPSCRISFQDTSASRPSGRLALAGDTVKAIGDAAIRSWIGRNALRRRRIVHECCMRLAPLYLSAKVVTISTAPAGC